MPPKSTSSAKYTPVWTLTLHSLLMGQLPPSTEEEELLINGFMSKLAAGTKSAFDSVKAGAGRLAAGTRSFYKGASEKASQYAATLSKAAQKYGTAVKEASAKAGKNLAVLGAASGAQARKFGQAALGVKERAAQYASALYKSASSGASKWKDATYKFVSEQASNARTLATSIRNKTHLQPSAIMNKLHDHTKAFASKTHLTKLFASKGGRTGVPTALVASGALGAAAATAATTKPSLWQRLTPAARKPLAVTHEKLVEAQAMADKKQRAGLSDEIEMKTLANHGAIQTPYKNLDDSFTNPTHSPYVPVPVRATDDGGDNGGANEEKGSGDTMLVRAGAVADGHPVSADNVNEIARLAAESAKERLAVVHLENHTMHATDPLIIGNDQPDGQTEPALQSAAQSATQSATQSVPIHRGHATPMLNPQHQKVLHDEIERQAQQVASEEVQKDEEHVKARAFHQMALESGRATVPARVSEAIQEVGESPSATVFQSLQPHVETTQEASQEVAQPTASTMSNAEPMPVELEQQPFETPNPRHALARVSTSPQAVHALDAHGVPIAEHHETTSESLLGFTPSTAANQRTNQTTNQTVNPMLVCKKLIEEYDMRRAAAAAHPEVFVHTLGATNAVARRALEERVAQGGITPYTTSTQVSYVGASPAISLMTLSDLLDHNEPIVLEVAHSKHFGGRTATLIRGDGKSLDAAGQVSHMTIEGNARRNQIEAQLYAYEPFFHPITSGQQYVLAELSEGGLHNFQTNQCEPAVALMIDWVLSNIILDPMLPPIDVY